jgi:hypothetical protein
MTTPTDENIAALSPGQRFAQDYVKNGASARVEFDFTITDAFQPTKERPRVTVRNLFKKRLVEGEVFRTWRESRSPADAAAGVTEGVLRREATFQFGLGEFSVSPIRGWVQIPEGLAHDVDGLAQFLDYRLLVRLATAENQALTIGEKGVLSHPEVAKLPYRSTYLSGLMAACDEIEQTGATAHAMIVNPRDYYTHMLGAGSVLTDLARTGTIISRTRMVDPGCALVGDFAMAAELLEAGRSVIAAAEPPAGTFAGPGAAVYAEIHEGVAVHLPTHFFHVVPA